jgi:hypothetical protein
MQTRILRSLISLLDSKFVLTNSTLNLRSLYIENLSPRSLILLGMPMQLFNFLALEVIIVLSGGCISFWLYFQRLRC